MGRLTARLLEYLQSWDRPTKRALVMALALLILDLIFISIATPQQRQAGIIGFIGLIIVIQVIIMWGNRGMTTAFTRAQRHYLNADFAAARDVLESERRANKADFRALTLLGNTYRQLGELDKSRTILDEALTIAPEHHFPLYGFGRTLLVEGHYAHAVEVFQQAVTANAPPIIQIDLGEALYRMGDKPGARTALEAARSIAKEPERELMVAFMLHQMESGKPPSIELARTGLAYWDATARRFQHTPYGAAVAADVHIIRSVVGDNEETQ